jgi:hypothetical protein
VVDYPLKVDGEVVRITACSTGNPHCSLFPKELDESVIHRLGSKLEHHPAFPNRTNVEFIRVLNERDAPGGILGTSASVTHLGFRAPDPVEPTVAAILNVPGRVATMTVHTRAG